MACVEIFALILKLVWVKKTQKNQCGKNVLLIKKIILEMLHRRISLNLVLLLLLVNFVSRFRLEWRYISLIVNINSSLFQLHGFQLLVLLS